MLSASLNKTFLSLSLSLKPPNIVLDLIHLKEDRTGKEGNVSFYNALNTIYLRLYGVRHNMVKDHSDNEEICCCHMSYYFRLAARILLYATTFVTPVMEHWLEQEITQWVHHEGSIRWPIAPWANALSIQIVEMEQFTSSFLWKYKTSILLTFLCLQMVYERDFSGLC